VRLAKSLPHSHPSLPGRRSCTEQAFPRSGQGPRSGATVQHRERGEGALLRNLHRCPPPPRAAPPPSHSSSFPATPALPCALACLPASCRCRRHRCPGHGHLLLAAELRGPTPPTGASWPSPSPLRGLLKAHSWAHARPGPAPQLCQGPGRPLHRAAAHRQLRGWPLAPGRCHLPSARSRQRRCAGHGGRLRGARGPRRRANRLRGLLQLEGGLGQGESASASGQAVRAASELATTERALPQSETSHLISYPFPPCISQFPAVRKAEKSNKKRDKHKCVWRVGPMLGAMPGAGPCSPRPQVS
jgi:hypothetical protein